MKQLVKSGVCIALALTLCGQAYAEKKTAHESPAARMEKVAYDLSESLNACRYAFELDKSKREAIVMDWSKEYMKAHRTLSVPQSVQEKFEHEAAAQLKTGGSKFEECRRNEKRDNLKDLKDITARFKPKYAEGIRKVFALWVTALDATGTAESSQAQLDFSNRAQALVDQLKND